MGQLVAGTGDSTPVGVTDLTLEPEFTMSRSAKVDCIELEKRVSDPVSPNAVSIQPESSQIAPVPSGSVELSYLAQLDQLNIRQQVEMLEAFTGIETKNRYQVLNSAGQQSFFVYEESELCMRICCKNHRGFHMHVLDFQNKEIIRMEREFVCCAGCCWCAGNESCGYKLKVESPVGNVIGTVRQACYCLIPRFEIRNAADEVTYTIKGPLCVCSGPCCPQDIPFMVTTPDGSQQVGCIARQYSGFFQEMFTKANNFRVNFDKSLDPTTKALIFSATFLIDMMFFERENGD